MNSGKVSKDGQCTGEKLSALAHCHEKKESSKIFSKGEAKRPFEHYEVQFTVLQCHNVNKIVCFY